MKTVVSTALATAMLAGLGFAPAPASAKTIKDCQKEWRADKVAMRAAGKTEKAYVAECRGKPAHAADAAAPKSDNGDKGSNY
jgi:hypothetical protein